MSATPPPLPADELAAREWPPLRAKLVDIAAGLDRLDRAGEAGAAARAEAEQMIQTLLEPGSADRAERVLKLLSLEYDPAWQQRFSADA